MKTAIALAVCLLFAANAAWALTPKEVIRLKKAGVSDAVIQKMLEQEAQGSAQPGPVEDKGGEVVYSAGQKSRAELQRQKEHERWKEKKAMDALQGVVIDNRQYTTPPAN